MPDAPAVALLVSVALFVVSGLVARMFVRRRYRKLPPRGKDPKQPEKDILVSSGDALGPVNWDFTESWASTMTAVGALLGTVLAEQTVPDGAWPLSSAALSSLSLLFGALALLAPLAFKALADRPDKADLLQADPARVGVERMMRVMVTEYIAFAAATAAIAAFIWRRRIRLGRA